MAGVRTVYRYNEQDQLTQVERPEGNVIARYGYDAEGLRAWKEVGGKKTYFYYTEHGLEAEYDEAGNVVRSYLYEPGGDWGTSPLMVRSGDERYFALNDHLGTPQKLIDTEGQEKWGARYSAFGIADVLTETVENPLRFPGQYYDAETGLHQNGLRYYDPQTGSCLTMDPYGVAVTGFNRYSYALGNPVSFTDPTGEIVPVVALMIFVRVALWVGAEAYSGWPTFRCAQFLSDPCKYPGGYEACQQAMLNAFLGWGMGRVVPFLVRPVAGAVRYLGKRLPLDPSVLYRAIGRVFGKSSGSQVSVASGVGPSGPMRFVRSIERTNREKLSDIVNELKARTFTTGDEHAVVKLADGTRAIVAGGPGGIRFPSGSVTRIYGHTHPTVAMPSALDELALKKLGQSKQYVFHGGEVTVVRQAR